MNEKQRQFLNLLPLGREVQIATSEYSVDPIPGQWNPVHRFTKQGIEALIKQGFLEGTTFWRGAEVTKVREEPSNWIKYTYCWCANPPNYHQVRVYRDTPEVKAYTEENGLASQSFEDLENTRKDVILKRLRELNVPRNQIAKLSRLMTDREDAILHPNGRITDY